MLNSLEHCEHAWGKDEVARFGAGASLAVICCLLHLHLILSIMLHFCHCLTKMKIQCHKRVLECVCVRVCLNGSPHGINRSPKLLPTCPRVSQTIVVLGILPMLASLLAGQQVCALKTLAMLMLLLLLLAAAGHLVWKCDKMIIK